jgi:hypothetical protein
MSQVLNIAAVMALETSPHLDKSSMYDEYINEVSKLTPGECVKVSSVSRKTDTKASTKTNTTKQGLVSVLKSRSIDTMYVHRQFESDHTYNVYLVKR